MAAFTLATFSDSRVMAGRASGKGWLMGWGGGGAPWNPCELHTDSLDFFIYLFIFIWYLLWDVMLLFTNRIGFR